MPSSLGSEYLPQLELSSWDGEASAQANKALPNNHNLPTKATSESDEEFANSLAREYIAALNDFENDGALTPEATSCHDKDAHAVEHM